MLQHEHLIAKIGFDTAENRRTSPRTARLRMVGEVRNGDVARAERLLDCVPRTALLTGAGAAGYGMVRLFRRDLFRELIS